jgi:hypothetical protein
MKFTFIIAILLCFLQSCTTYYFTSPQPAGGEKLSEIPVNLRGRWNCIYDSLDQRKCLEDGGYFIGSNQIEIKEKNQTTTWKIGQEVEMLKLNDYYVLNFVESRKLVDSKGKQVSSPLYSSMVISEYEGAVTLWNIDGPWDKKSEKKFRRAEMLMDAAVEDSAHSSTNFLLDFSLKLTDLESQVLLKPTMILLSDSTILSGDDIEWNTTVDYNCEGPNFENASDERKYYRLEDQLSRLYVKQHKIQRKQDILSYNDQFIKVFGDVEKGYVLLKTEEFFTDSSGVKHPFNFSEKPRKYEVYRLVEYYKNVVPIKKEYLYIDGSQIVPNNIAQEYIQLHKISSTTFEVNGKPREEGATTWNYLSEDNKKKLIEFIGYSSLDE